MIALIITVGLFALAMFLMALIAWTEDKTCPKCGGYMAKVYGWDKEECKSCGHQRKC